MYSPRSDLGLDAALYDARERTRALPVLLGLLWALAVVGFFTGTCSSAGRASSSLSRFASASSPAIYVWSGGPRVRWVCICLLLLRRRELFLRVTAMVSPLGWYTTRAPVSEFSSLVCAVFGSFSGCPPSAGPLCQNHAGCLPPSQHRRAPCCLLRTSYRSMSRLVSPV